MRKSESNFNLIRVSQAVLGRSRRRRLVTVTREYRDGVPTCLEAPYCIARMWDNTTLDKHHA